MFLQSARQQHGSQRMRRRARLRSRLPKHRIASHQRLQRLHARQQQGVIRRRNNQHHTERQAMRLHRIAPQPYRTPARRLASWSQQPLRCNLQVAACFGQRQNLRRQRLCKIALQRSRQMLRNGGRQILRARGNFAAQRSHHAQPRAHRRLPPPLLRRAHGGQQPFCDSRLCGMAGGVHDGPKNTLLPPCFAATMARPPTAARPSGLRAAAAR